MEERQIAEDVRPPVAAWGREVRLFACRASAGRGVDGDPVRTIYHLFTAEGALVAHYDPWAARGIATAEMQRLMGDV